MKCTNCQDEPVESRPWWRRWFGADRNREGPTFQASIKLFVNGHECRYSYWRCRSCGLYTIEACSDRWDGNDPRTILGPWPAEVGEKCVELVNACPHPSDEECACESHKALYNGTPS